MTENPYEPPQVHDEQKQKPPARKWLILLAMFLGAMLFVAGMALFTALQVGTRLFNDD